MDLVALARKTTDFLIVDGMRRALSNTLGNEYYSAIHHAINRRHRTFLCLLMVVGFICLGNPFAFAQVPFQQLYAFPTSAPGAWHPATCLVEGVDGNFYGTTVKGGTNNFGTVFKVTPSGVFTVLDSFNGANGLSPRGGLVVGKDGNFYGTSSGNGATSFGTVFRMLPNGVLTTVFTFQGTNGSSPYGRLQQASNGILYGTTFNGGPAGLGVLFGISTNGVLTTFVPFYGTNGSQPYAGLIGGADGAFYGTTQYGGSNFAGANTGSGTVFRVTTNGALTTLVYFNVTNGSHPTAGLVQSADGNLYGTTSDGGDNNLGTVFHVTTNGDLKTLASFGPAGAAKPYGGLTQGADGAFYGTTIYNIIGSTYSYGTIFKVTADGVLTTLVDLDGTNGTHPFTDLMLASDGYLYGAMADATLSYSANGGTLFRLGQPALIKSVVSSNGSTTVSWFSFSNGVYQVERTASMVNPDWTALTPTVTAHGAGASFTEATAQTPETYYRVVLLP